ncbi:MAG TPA: ferritin-like domain-containing protein [Stellaceae bacterium]
MLGAAEPARKLALSRALAAAWGKGDLAVGSASAPPRPARPARPLLLPPRDMPKRRNFGSAHGRIALLHALAHIELNAIDLAWDIVARFSGAGMSRTFYDDWVGVAAEEAEHFALLADRLAALGAAYGDLPAHDGLWEAAAATAHDLLARLAVVPLVLEARGLDVTPEMIRRLERAGDPDSAAILDRIYRDEIGHVAAGARWFDRLCREQGLEPGSVFHDRVRRHFTGSLKPPFNRAARDAAGFPASYYERLASEPLSRTAAEGGIGSPTGR